MDFSINCHQNDINQGEMDGAIVTEDEKKAKESEASIQKVSKQRLSTREINARTFNNWMAVQKLMRTPGGRSVNTFPPSSARKATEVCSLVLKDRPVPTPRKTFRNRVSSSSNSATDSPESSPIPRPRTLRGRRKEMASAPMTLATMDESTYEYNTVVIGVLPLKSSDSWSQDPFEVSGKSKSEENISSSSHVDLPLPEPPYDDFLDSRVIKFRNSSSQASYALPTPRDPSEDLYEVVHSVQIIDRAEIGEYSVSPIHMGNTLLVIEQLREEFIKSGNHSIKDPRARNAIIIQRFCNQIPKGQGSDFIASVEKSKILVLAILHLIKPDKSFKSKDPRDYVLWKDFRGELEDSVNKERSSIHSLGDSLHRSSLLQS